MKNPRSVMPETGGSTERGLSLNEPVDLPVLSAERKEMLLSFQKTALVTFKNLELLNMAMIHRSVSNEANHHYNNERLEFLGDSILGAITSTLLYEYLVGKPEGDLAKTKAVVVSEEVLSALARELQIDALLLLGHGEELSGGRNKNAILADALEALIGALYLDSGYQAAFSFMTPRLKAEIDRVVNKQHHQDYKSLLQELSQRFFKTCPVYHLIKCSGPDHDHFFWISTVVNGQTFGPGVGKNKKAAEQEAAKMAYEALSRTLV
jgi:ribonuclease-3